jgi:hypothetical protein
MKRGGKMAEELLSWHEGPRRRRRMVFSDDRWREFILEWDQSGLSVSEFCRQRGLRLKNFYRVRHKIFGAGLPDPTGSAGSSPALPPDLPSPADATSEGAPPPQAPHDPGPAFIPVTVVEKPVTFPEPPAEDGAPKPIIEVVLPGNRVVRILGPFDPGFLRKVIHVLEGLPC